MEATLQSRRLSMHQSQSANSASAAYLTLEDRTCLTGKEIPDLLAKHALFLSCIFQLSMIFTQEESSTAREALSSPSPWADVLWIKDIKLLTNSF